MKRDVLTRLDSLTKKDGGIRFRMPVRREVKHRSGGRSGKRRFDARAWSVVSVAAVIALVANAGVAWTYWRVIGSDTARGGNGTAVEMTLAARSDPDAPLAIGGRGDLAVTLINDRDFPIRIVSVSRGPGRAVADDEHREAGCTNPDVELAREQFQVSWEVPKNTLGAFTIPDGLTRGYGADRACEGAAFTLAIQVSGTGR